MSSEVVKPEEVWIVDTEPISKSLPIQSVPIRPSLVIHSRVDGSLRSRAKCARAIATRGSSPILGTLRACELGLTIRALQTQAASQPGVGINQTARYESRSAQRA